MGMPPSSYSKALREPTYFLYLKKPRQSKASLAKFRSKKAVGLGFGGREIVFDHAIPFKYLQYELLKLADVTPQSVE
jgi:hypothetical protein